MWGALVTEASIMTNFNVGFSTHKSDILVHLSQWQYWWWFWFSLAWVLYYYIILFNISKRTFLFNPVMNTSTRGHGKWGDFLVALVPLSWCGNILVNSNFILRMIEWQNEGSLFTVRIQAKQWYWVYKYDITTAAAMTSIPRNIGHDKWIIWTPSDSYRFDTYNQPAFLATQLEFWNTYTDYLKQNDLINKNARLNSLTTPHQIKPTWSYTFKKNLNKNMLTRFNLINLYPTKHLGIDTATSSLNFKAKLQKFSYFTKQQALQTQRYVFKIYKVHTLNKKRPFFKLLKFKISWLASKPRRLLLNNFKSFFKTANSRKFIKNNVHPQSSVNFLNVSVLNKILMNKSLSQTLAKKQNSNWLFKPNISDASIYKLFTHYSNLNRSLKSGTSGANKLIGLWKEATQNKFFKPKLNLDSHLTTKTVSTLSKKLFTLVRTNRLKSLYKLKIKSKIKLKVQTPKQTPEFILKRFRDITVNYNNFAFFVKQHQFLKLTARAKINNLEYSKNRLKKIERLKNNLQYLNLLNTKKHPVKSSFIKNFVWSFTPKTIRLYNYPHSTFKLKLINLEHAIRPISSTAYFIQIKNQYKFNNIKNIYTKLNLSLKQLYAAIYLKNKKTTVNSFTSLITKLTRKLRKQSFEMKSITFKKLTNRLNPAALKSKINQTSTAFTAVTKIKNHIFLHNFYKPNSNFKMLKYHQLNRLKNWTRFFKNNPDKTAKLIIEYFNALQKSSYKFTITPKLRDFNRLISYFFRAKQFNKVKAVYKRVQPECVACKRIVPAKPVKKTASMRLSSSAKLVLKYNKNIGKNFKKIIGWIKTINLASSLNYKMLLSTQNTQSTSLLTKSLNYSLFTKNLHPYINSTILTNLYPITINPKVNLSYYANSTIDETSDTINNVRVKHSIRPLRIIKSVLNSENIKRLQEANITNISERDTSQFLQLLINKTNNILEHKPQVTEDVWGFRQKKYKRKLKFLETKKIYYDPKTLLPMTEQEYMIKNVIKNQANISPYLNFPVYATLYNLPEKHQTVLSYAKYKSINTADLASNIQPTRYTVDYITDKSTFTENGINSTSYFNYGTVREYRKKNEIIPVTLARRLLRTKRTLVLPAHVNITLITNSYDVVHSWFVPGLGLKLDCVPGRSTHHTLYIDNIGFYYGQCAEICGRYHHHMPIRVCALPFEHFLVWWHVKGLPRVYRFKAKKME